MLCTQNKAGLANFWMPANVTGMETLHVPQEKGGRHQRRFMRVQVYYILRIRWIQLHALLMT